MEDIVGRRVVGFIVGRDVGDCVGLFVIRPTPGNSTASPFVNICNGSSSNGSVVVGSTIAGATSF